MIYDNTIELIIKAGAPTSTMGDVDSKMTMDLAQHWEGPLMIAYYVAVEVTRSAPNLLMEKG
jgi:hypothetical protein